MHILAKLYMFRNKNKRFIKGEIAQSLRAVYGAKIQPERLESEYGSIFFHF